MGSLLLSTQSLRPMPPLKLCFLAVTMDTVDTMATPTDTDMDTDTIRGKLNLMPSLRLNLLLTPTMDTMDTVWDTVDTTVLVTTDTPTDTDTGSAKLKLKLNLLLMPLLCFLAVAMDTVDTMATLTDTTDTTTKAPSRSRYKNSTPSFHQDQPKLKQFFETSNPIRTKYKIVELISIF